MRHTLLSSIVLAVAAFVAGPFVGWMCGMLVAWDGGPDATPLVSSSLPLGIGVLLASLAVAAVVGVLGGRLCGIATGLMASGFSLAWGAWELGHIDGVLRSANSAGPFSRLAVEGLLTGGGAALVAWAVVRAARGRGHAMPQAHPVGESLIGMGATVVVGGIVALVLARTAMVGQTFGAGIGAAMVGVLVGRLVAPSASVLFLVGAGAVLGALGPIAGMLFSQPEPFRAMVEGGLHPLARVMPMDWATGFLIGTPIGAGWASSMTEKHAEPEPTGVGSPVQTSA